MNSMENCLGKMEGKTKYYLFLIITFSSDIICIRNEKILSSEDFQGNIIDKKNFFPRYADKDHSIGEDRQFFSDRYSIRNPKFAFPERQENYIYNSNQNNFFPSVGNFDNYTALEKHYRRENPHKTLPLNSGEYLQNTNKVYSNYQRPVANLNYPALTSASNRYRLQSAVQNNFYGSNDNYAQNYNYQNKKIPYYKDGIPTLATQSANIYQFQGPQNYNPLYHRPQPFRPSRLGLHSSNNYAGQNHNYKPSFAQNFLNNLGYGTNGAGGEISGKISKALGDITKYDDLQCVPKLICQMIGDRNRNMQLPSFITSPAFTALISAVPSVSPPLILGRAALIGYAGGEESCEGSYPKCPRNEDDLLYYLNNHRGGFFKFFNGGSAFGDEDSDSNYQNNPDLESYDQQYQSQFTTPQHQTSSPVDSLLNLQSLANAINQMGGINLSNFGSNFASLLSNNNNNHKSISPQSSAESSNPSNVVGNLLTGLLGNRFTSRKLRKRSIVTNKNNKTTETPKDSTDKNGKKIKYLASDDTRNISSEIEDVQARIINAANPIRSIHYDENKMKILFPLDANGDVFKFDLHLSNENSKSTLQFPTDENSDNRYGKQINFLEPTSTYFPTNDNQDYTSSMVFPDRTGTGNLRFDSDEFTQRDEKRFGKILTGVKNRFPQYSVANYQRPSKGYSDYEYLDRFRATSTTTSRPFYNNYHKARPQHSRYDYTNGNYFSANRYTTTRKPYVREPDPNIYVTNSRGVVEYYVNPKGDKVYV